MRRSPLLPIFLVVLVDILGFTIVYPVLPFYALEFGASPLTATLLVSVYAACSLIATPIIGRLSDRYGRRRLLLISQAGTCAGFIVLGVSEALWMVFLGRILDGLTAGNLSTAQAYISDHTEPQNRAKAFGVIGIAFGVGFAAGPALGGLLSVDGNEHVPFLFAACLSALSMICTYALLEPGLPPHAPAPGAGSEAAGPAGSDRAASGPGGKRPGLFELSTYLEYFRRPGLGILYLQFFLYTFMFSAFMGGFALFALQQFTTADGQRWTSTQVGYLFAYVGFLGIIIQGGLLGRLVKQLGEVKLVIAGGVALTVAYTSLGFIHTLALLVITSTISAFGNSVLRPVLTGLITQRVGRHEQGVALGISASLSSLSMTIAPPLGGLFLDHGWLVAWAMVPAATAALGLVAALAGRSSSRPSNRPSNQSSNPAPDTPPISS